MTEDFYRNLYGFTLWFFGELNSNSCFCLFVRDDIPFNWSFVEMDVFLAGCVNSQVLGNNSNKEPTLRSVLSDPLS